MSFWLTMRQLLVLELELGAGVLGVEDLVADLDVHRLALAVVVEAAGAGGEDRALLRLLLGRVGQDDAALGHLLAGGGLDDDAVASGRSLVAVAVANAVPSWNCLSAGSPARETSTALDWADAPGVVSTL